MKIFRSVPKWLLIDCLLATGCFFAVVAWSQQSAAPQPITVDSMFRLMGNQMVDVVCEAPEFKACFDVPFAECSRELKSMLADCRKTMADELPELIRAEDSDPIITKAYACVIPKWDALIKSRRTPTRACLRIEREIKDRENL